VEKQNIYQGLAGNNVMVKAKWFDKLHVFFNKYSQLPGVQGQ